MKKLVSLLLAAAMLALVVPAVSYTHLTLPTTELV